MTKSAISPLKKDHRKVEDLISDYTNTQGVSAKRKLAKEPTAQYKKLAKSAATTFETVKV